jgi:hypothetical protein
VSSRHPAREVLTHIGHWFWASPRVPGVRIPVTLMVREFVSVPRRYADKLGKAL